MGECSCCVGDTFVRKVYRESVKQYSKIPLNSLNRGKTWQRPCVQTRKKKVVIMNRLWHRIVSRLSDRVACRFPLSCSSAVRKDGKPLACPQGKIDCPSNLQVPHIVFQCSEERRKTTRISSRKDRLSFELAGSPCHVTVQ